MAAEPNRNARQARASGRAAGKWRRNPLKRLNCGLEGEALTPLFLDSPNFAMQFVFFGASWQSIGDQ
jgi:hypothetical protein